MGRRSRSFRSFVDAVEVRLTPAPYTETLPSFCYSGLLAGTAPVSQPGMQGGMKLEGEQYTKTHNIQNTLHTTHNTYHMTHNTHDTHNIIHTQHTQLLVLVCGAKGHLMELALQFLRQFPDVLLPLPVAGAGPESLRHCRCIFGEGATASASRLSGEGVSIPSSLGKQRETSLAGRGRVSATRALCCVRPCICTDPQPPHEPRAPWAPLPGECPHPQCCWGVRRSLLGRRPPARP